MSVKNWAVLDTLQVEERIPSPASPQKVLLLGCSHPRCSKRVSASGFGRSIGGGQGVLPREGPRSCPAVRAILRRGGRWSDKALEGLSALLATRLSLRRGWTEHCNHMHPIPRSSPDLPLSQF